LAILFSVRAQGGTLPGALSTAEIDRIAKLVAMGGAVRLLRSAESYPLWPGVKIGAEITLFPGDRLADLGNGLGSVSSFLPMPRVYFAKGLIEDVEIVASFFPFNLNTVNGGGAIAKWTFVHERENWVTVAGIFGVTAINAFQDEFQGANLELGAVVSKDFVTVKPYAGASLMFARGKVLSSLAASTSETSALLGTHFYLGAEVAFPVSLAVQLDLINLDPTLSAFAGVKF
jgi:hypothetical protein